ncbi:hypothetical protein FGO68_gene3454 [Halteria grandinella]|uniref:Uncharacterized protein n=1 Tax=Halteria grandinella TaxID=5974 RepID=A0A8J8NNL0_HALGN|nr:hypothetical protein FGO68_gene3454 [Halteria grandinella]
MSQGILIVIIFNNMMIRSTAGHQLAQTPDNPDRPKSNLDLGVIPPYLHITHDRPLTTAHPSSLYHVSGSTPSSQLVLKKGIRVLKLSEIKRKLRPISSSGGSVEDQQQVVIIRKAPMSHRQSQNNCTTAVSMPTSPREDPKKVGSSMSMDHYLPSILDDPLPNIKFNAAQICIPSHQPIQVSLRAQLGKVRPLSIPITPGIAQLASIQQMESVQSVGRLKKGGVSVHRQLPPLLTLEEDSSVIVGRHIRSRSLNPIPHPQQSGHNSARDVRIRQTGRNRLDSHNMSNRGSYNSSLDESHDKKSQKNKVVLDVHIPSLGPLRLDRTELSKVYEDGEEFEETPLQTEKYGYRVIFEDIEGMMHPSAFSGGKYLGSGEDPLDYGRAKKEIVLQIN